MEIEHGKEPGSVRIIGGRFRGRKLQYSGDPRTRPMKDRVREAVFNLLADDVRGKLAIDLFAGTGVLALESISRGSHQAICIEQHFPSAELIRQSSRMLGVLEIVDVVSSNVFIWVRRLVEGTLPPGTVLVPTNLPGNSASHRPAPPHQVPASPVTTVSPIPWLVFCSPPYAFYQERRDDMLTLLTRLVTAAPAGSLFVVEADEACDFATLPQPGPWDIRAYPPAVVGIARMP